MQTKNLKVGKTIQFKKTSGHFADKVYTRKIQSVYKKPFFNHEKNDWDGFEYRYNTRGHNGGYGCEGFSVEENEIIKTN